MKDPQTSEKIRSQTNRLLPLSHQGLNEVLCEICASLKWDKPTKIQRETLPYALEGKDIIGLAETGSYSEILLFLTNFELVI